MKEPNFTVLLATSGRATLRQTLDSIATQQLLLGDEVWLVADGPNAYAAQLWEEFRLPGRYLEIEGPNKDWGHTVRNQVQHQISNDFILHMDDDDIYLPWAFRTIRKYVAKQPNKPHLFRTLFCDEVHSVWGTPNRLAFGNVTTVNFALPRSGVGWQQWPAVAGGDFYFLEKQYKAGELVWVDEHTCLSRPHKAQLPVEQLVMKLAGPWTAHNLRFGDFQTYVDNVDTQKLQRISKLVTKLAPEAETLLDLAALEGLYSFHFTTNHRVTAVEARHANVKKLEAAHWLARHHWPPSTILPAIVEKDVRELASLNKAFDVVLCLGILYHLPAEDLLPFLRQVRASTHMLCLIDTHIALTEVGHAAIDGEVYHGKMFTEFALGTAQTEVERMHWSSVDNAQSFWPTKESLTRLLTKSGFSTVTEVLQPPAVAQPADRVVLACWP